MAKREMDMPDNNGRPQQRKVLIETAVLMGISVTAMVESLRLIIFTDPHVLYDPVGPGYYLLFISIGLIATSCVHYFKQSRNPRGYQKTLVSKEMRRKMIIMVLVCAMYIVLIDIVGYQIATIIFYFFIFRVAGVRSWPATLAMTAILSSAHYFIFIRYCSMVFPRGIIFG